MGTIGGQELLKKHGDMMAVAEALLEGRIDGYDLQFMSEIVSKVVLEAAKFRVEQKLKVADTLDVLKQRELMAHDEPWCAWLQTHNAHGAVLDTLVYLPPDDVPEKKTARLRKWMRAPWLDAPHKES